ncbi:MULTISPECIES: hypothetical protein [unclassified Campylobacter]|uniref:hypothetical protein n=1 Tax=unclassified Campylobacter TaxID=2593542 RepID=UPI0014728D2E|nr:MULTISPECIES: hypothetical protein [unclassified Campylobacter]
MTVTLKNVNHDTLNAIKAFLAFNKDVKIFEENEISEEKVTIIKDIKENKKLIALDSLNS